MNLYTLLIALVFAGWATAADPIPEAPKADAVQDQKWEAKGDPAGHPSGTDAKAESKEKKNNGIIDDQMIEEIQARRSDLEKREKALAQQEAELKKRETVLQEELQKLSGIRSEILGMSQDQKKKQEERVAKLVETFERMSPKSASELLMKMEETLAVSTMNGLSTEKLAKILNVMDPAKSSQLSELMAGRKRSQQQAKTEKGGEKQ